MNILLIDDSRFMAKAMNQLLQQMGYTVVAVAHDGASGIEAYKSFHPQVTLMDVTMPNMDGLECLQRIREIDPDARIVMLSAVTDTDTIQRCLDSGARGFLQKPIRPTSPSDLSRLTEAVEGAASQATGSK